MEDFNVLANRILESLDDLKKIILKAETSQESGIKSHKRFEIKGDIKLDNLKQTLIVGDKEIQLTYKEWGILRELIRSEDGIGTYEELCKRIYGYEEIDDFVRNSIRAAISRLEQKTKGLIEIRTIRKVGYLLKEVKSDAGTN